MINLTVNLFRLTWLCDACTFWHKPLLLSIIFGSNLVLTFN